MELLRDRRQEFEEAGVRPLAISRDSPRTHIAWAQALDLDFGLLSDWNAEAVRGFGVAQEYRGLEEVAAVGVPDRHRRNGEEGLELRELGGSRLRRVARRRPGFVALACALYLVAGMVATAPAIRHGGTHFLADGAPGLGEAAPGDHLQTAYHFWLIGDDLEHGRAPWRDPYSFRSEARWTLNPAAWPFGLGFWPLWRALGVVLAWNVFVLLSFVAAGGLPGALLS